MREPKYRDIKSEILESSFEYLSKNGLENISMRDLCKGVGISIGSVYYWFENKEELIAETAEYGLRKVSDDIFIYAFENIRDIESGFEGCFDKINEHRVALRFIYQLASSPVYGDVIRKRGSDLESVYHEYAIRLSKTLDRSVDFMLPLVYLFVSAVLDYAVWEDYTKTKAQLDYISTLLKRSSTEST